jgi:hypothetical protein
LKYLSLLFILFFIGCNHKSYPVTTNPTEETLSLDAIQKSVCRIHTMDGGFGSGFFFKTDDDTKYHIMTSAHVVENSPLVKIELFYNGYKSEPYLGRVVEGAWNIEQMGYAPHQIMKGVKPVDTAIIELDKFTDYPEAIPLELAPEDYEYKEEIIKSAGFPKGAAQSSWLGIAEPHEDFLLFEPIPLKGRSGSPLVNTKNQVIGIITTNYGLAVRIDVVREFLFPVPPSPPTEEQGKI